ncbi:hypothetical protein GCM10027347_59600 [Larkinella harenae]
MNEPFTLYPITPLTEIENIEIHGCVDDGENTEQVPDDQAQFWSVYLRYKQNAEGFGGLDCVADCPSREKAQELGTFLSAIMKLEA